jgi:hypothetical protein
MATYKQHGAKGRRLPLPPTPSRGIGFQPVTGPDRLEAYPTVFPQGTTP